MLRLDDGTHYIVDWINVTGLTNAGIIVAAKQAVVSGARIVVTGFRIKMLTIPCRRVGGLTK